MSSIAEAQIQEIDQVLGQQSLGFGLMLVKGMTDPFEYAIYEISHHNLGIITAGPLEIGSSVVIERSESQLIPLIVHQIIPKKNLPLGYRRYLLISVDPEIDFERILPEMNYRRYLNASRQHYHVRYTRFPTEIPIRVDAKTFGSAEIHSLKTMNISKSGFLLATPPGFRVPFNESTLLELTVHIENEEPLHCLGKVIRCEFDFEKKMKRYGIHISEIAGDARERYSSMVEDIEHRKNRQVFRLLNLPMPT